MLPDPGYKVCPICGELSGLAGVQCVRCGHQFRTNFANPMQQTQAFYSALNPGPAQPFGGQPYYVAPAQRPGIIQLPPGQHSSALSILLSVLLGWWLGAIANRQYVKGLILLAISVAAFWFGSYVGLLPLWILGVVDTTLVGKAIELGFPVRDMAFFPQSHLARSPTVRMPQGQYQKRDYTGCWVIAAGAAVLGFVFLWFLVIQPRWAESSRIAAIKEESEQRYAKYVEIAEMVLKDRYPEYISLEDATVDDRYNAVIVRGLAAKPSGLLTAVRIAYTKPTEYGGYTRWNVLYVVPDYGR